MIRKASVAGAFYPGDPGELRNMVRELLDRAPYREVKGEVKGLISPHAGYVYSGLVAAVGYKLLAGKDIRKVIILGPSHSSYFRGIAVYSHGMWETPLGSVPVDEELTAHLLSCQYPFFEGPQFHEDEHSIEVQIPFLQLVLDDFSIIPLLFGFGNSDDFVRAGEAIGNLASRQDAVIIASSDLYHGYSYEEAVKTDSYTLELIENGDPTLFAKELSAERAQACGGWPIVALMAAMRKIQAKPKVLFYANSGDITGIKTGYVVGYGSVAFTSEPGKNDKLTLEEKAKLLEIARRSVEAAVRGMEPVIEVPDSPRLLEKRGVFVTLKKGGQLRGCIGYVLPIKPLYEATKDVAISAALRDPRFPPVTPEELPHLEYEISVLTVPRRIKNIDEIVPGKHGLIVKRGFFEGLLLPQVATEYGWDTITFLQHTCLKAGMEPDCFNDPETEIYVFEAEVFGESEVRS